MYLKYYQSEIRGYLFVSIFIIIFLQTFNIFPQVVEEWVTRYNSAGNGNDNAKDLILDLSGNIYVTGTDYGGYNTVKYNDSGIQQWAVTHTTPGYDYSTAVALAVDNAGNVYVTGGSYSSSNHRDFVTVKYNNSGVQQWFVTYNGTVNYDDYVSDIVVDDAGNVYIVGSTNCTGINSDCIVIKYNTVGVQQWIAVYNNIDNGNDAGNAIALDNLGNVYVTGDSDFNVTSLDYLTIKYDNNGVQQWVSTYSGSSSGWEFAYSIAVDNSGNVYVTGQSGGANENIATVKYNSSGIQQWVDSYNGITGRADVGNTIAIDNEGNVYVTGYADYNDWTNTCDIITIKYNNLGAREWVALYNGDGNVQDQANAIALDTAGNVYVTGFTDYATPGVSPSDYVTIKYDSNGVQKWVMKYNGTANSGDTAYDIAVDDVGNVFVTGSSAGLGTNSDYATIKYSPIPAFASNTFYFY